jgi:hypothetical protein
VVRKRVKYQETLAWALDEVLLHDMKKLSTRVRSYGWFCPKCSAHRNADQIDVAKIVGNKYITMVCSNCRSELVDCFVVKEKYPVGQECEHCIDRFQCFTRADAIIEKDMITLRSHEVTTSPIVEFMAKEIIGVRSYTGIYNDKLANPPICIYPDRIDCNNSWMRFKYNGVSYKRCEYMKYNVKEKLWYCLRVI